MTIRTRAMRHRQGPHSRDGRQPRRAALLGEQHQRPSPWNDEFTVARALKPDTRVAYRPTGTARRPAWGRPRSCSACFVVVADALAVDEAIRHTVACSAVLPAIWLWPATIPLAFTPDAVLNVPPRVPRSIIPLLRVQENAWFAPLAIRLIPTTWPFGLTPDAKLNAPPSVRGRPCPRSPSRRTRGSRNYPQRPGRPPGRSGSTPVAPLVVPPRVPRSTIPILRPGERVAGGIAGGRGDPTT